MIMHRLIILAEFLNVGIEGCLFNVRGHMRRCFYVLSAREGPGDSGSYEFFSQY